MGRAHHLGHSICLPRRSVFNIGDRVMVAMGNWGWRPASVVKQWELMPELTQKMSRNIRLDIGELAYVPRDTEAYIKNFVPSIV